MCTHTDSGIKYVKRVTSFVEERIHAEQNYAKELRPVGRGTGGGGVDQVLNPQETSSQIQAERG